MKHGLLKSSYGDAWRKEALGLQLQHLARQPSGRPQEPQRHKSPLTPELCLRGYSQLSHRCCWGRRKTTTATSAALTTTGWPLCHPHDGAFARCEVIVATLRPGNRILNGVLRDGLSSRSWRCACQSTNNYACSTAGGDSSSRSSSTTTSSAISAPAAAASDAQAGSSPHAAARAAAGASATSLGRGGPDPDEISRRITASRARRASRLSYSCPACSISVATPANVARHMARCCPDIMAPDRGAWEKLDSLPRGFPSPQHDAVVALLRAAGKRELELRRRVLTCVFWSGPIDPETGLPSRLEAEEAARRLGLPTARASSVLQRAMASVPLACDSGGAPLDIVYEDEHFLAVNKPAGLHTAPIHRFTGGSVVNKVIAYLNRGRSKKYGSSGGSNDTAPVTLLNPPLAFDGIASGGLYGSSIPELMPLPEPFTLTLFSSAAPAATDPSEVSTDSDSGEVAQVAGGSSSTEPYQLEPYVLHRLDMNTSGLLLFAKRPEVVAGMHRQFRERSLSKLYLAACVGCPDVEGGDLHGCTVYGSGGGSRPSFYVDAPIDRHPFQAVARRVADTGKEASTSFAVLASNPLADLGASAGGAPGLLFHEQPHSGTRAPPHAAASAHPTTTTPGASSASAVGLSNGTDMTDGTAAALAAAIPGGASLVLCAPHTGRTHQIRVHLHHAGHPIVGDDIYGVTGPWLSRQALHAAALHFTHPLTGRPVRLSAPLHDDMAACMAALGLPVPDAEAVAEAEEEWRRPPAGAGMSKGLGGRQQKRRR